MSEDVLRDSLLHYSAPRCQQELPEDYSNAGISRKALFYVKLKHVNFGGSESLSSVSFPRPLHVTAAGSRGAAGDPAFSAVQKD